MGVDIRKNPPLPAATESSTLPTSGDEVPTDLATDISRRTDRTSYSVPEDGSPITVRTSGKGDKHTHRKDQSQTSLLIEYFEGGKGPNVHSRPSVRVKVTPSSAKKGQDTKDHIQVTQTEGNRKPSYTRRISLGPKDKGETHVIEGRSKSVSSLAEDSNLSARPPPIEVEVMHRDQESDLSGTSVSRENRYMAYNQSEVSSMPPDSMLESNLGHSTPKRSRSRSLTGIATASTAAAIGAAAVADTLKAPTRKQSRSPSRERLTEKVMEKLAGKEPRLTSGKHKHSSKSRSRSVSKEQLTETVSSPRRKSGKHHRVEDQLSDPSVITGSQLSDTRSYRSDISKSSLANPKLLQAVEDSIRRLILPELNALKAEQKVQRESSGRRDSVSSSRSGEVSKRVSKISSDPSVRSKTHREDSLKKKSRRHHEKYDESPSERSFEREKSQETVVHDGGKHRKRSKESGLLREAAAGAAAGLLTQAALKHHDSNSTVDRKERRRKRSKSHSRSQSATDSVAGTEEIFSKHDVPPMPIMRSEMTNSDVTRDSILSECTSTPTSENRRTEIRHVARASPKDQVYSPSQTPTRSPSGLRNSATYDDEYQDDYSQSTQSYENEPHHYGEAALGGVAAGAGLMAARHAFEQNDGVTASGYQHGRSLSPIQSVASFEERDELSRKNSKRRPPTTGSLSSLDKQDKHSKHLSLDSAQSYQPKSRPEGFSLETGSDILAGHEHDLREKEVEEDQKAADESWFEGDDGERYRNSTGVESYDSSTVPARRLTQYTDDSMEANYLDKVTAAQEVRGGVGANPEWVHTPVAVESAVASLHEPSTLDAYSTKSARSYLGEHHADSPGSDGRREFSREQHEGRYNTGSPLKQRQDLGGTEESVRDSQLTMDSPRQSLPPSEKNRESYVEMTGSALPIPNDPLPEIMDVDSEISTNPPDIQGPKKYDTPIQWPYHQATPPQTRADMLSKSNNNSTHDSLASAAKNMLGVAAAAGAAAAINQQRRKRKDSFEGLDNGESERDYGEDAKLRQGLDGGYDTTYTNDNDRNLLTSPRDEGYVTQQEQDRSTGALTPDNRHKKFKAPELFPDPTGGIGIAGVGDPFGLDKGDPFMATDPRRISGNSHGMMSPLYDAATGQGIDRIQSKDIIALMDHLTVRDAQRNARDTEILVTLVRSAAEMRNSFDDLRTFIRDQNDMMIQVGNKQHEKTQRVIGGPRPQPAKAPRRTLSAEDSFTDDIPSKRRNVFRRALKGLSGKNNGDIQRIEEMLNQLLEEVADLKASQDARPTTAFASRAPPGLSSYEQLRDNPMDHQDGYEPEGQAGTSSTENHSGYFSNPGSGRNSRQALQDRRRASQNRVSTVMEEREEEVDAPLEQHEQEILQYDNTEEMLTPTRDLPRGGSAPAETPQAATFFRESQSTENTPKTDKGRRSKANTSWFSPKISRWSKTTASSIPEGGRRSLQKDRPSSEHSRSGSDLPNYDGEGHYDPIGDDRIRSNTSLVNDGRPPSPLVPSAVSEKPQYQAHRNSINLQHPQPRQGSTARYQNHLESQVRDLTKNSPISPSSDQFGSNPILSARFAGNAGNRNSGGVGNLSPISDVGAHNELAAQKSSGPPRPPKIRDDGPLIPPKVPIDVENKPSYVGRSAPARELSQSNGANLSPPSCKKPSGPRPQAASGSFTPDRAVTVPRKQYRGSPNALPGSDEDETF